ncbi:MAG: riboflavin biosynthesis protein RibF [Candidatus Marinimicrobia bacterium]|nr:riboflavin biosynthesis protein RibF [Candidatus Neomarinimicrobiota bacterium]
MRIYKDIPNKHVLNRSVVSIGSFDGMHLGHQKIINFLKTSSEDGGESVLITFHSTPQHFFLKENFKGYLSSKNEKISLIREMGVDNLCIINFDISIKNLSADLFLKKIIKAFSPRLFVVGYDHSFGKNREGDLSFLNKNKKKYSFNTVEISEVINVNAKISSSKIRASLESRNLKEARIALGRFYSLRGTVIKGRGLGKKIGFPTANMAIVEDKLVPGSGVYFVEAVIGTRKFKGMCNIGFNPTVKSNNELSVEVHFFNLRKDLYNKEIVINFIDFIRKERKFKDIKSLKEQLVADKNKCLEYSLYNV